MGAYSAAVIADGASHYWRLGEPSGTTAADAVAGGANAPGTISGGVTLGQPGPLADGSTAMLFDGATGKILTASISLPVTSTVELWLKSSLVGQQAGLSMYPASGTGPFCGLNPAGRFFVYGDSPAGSVLGTLVLADGQWHHLVAVLNGTVCQLYVDGAADGTPQAFGRNVLTTSILALGAMTAGTDDLLNGSLAECALYPLALTPAQIAAHYALRTATGGGGGASPLTPWNLVAGLEMTP